MPATSSREHYEDLHTCLRLAQLLANQAHDRQLDGKRWLSCYLQALQDSGVELFERTTKRISYTPTDAVFEDVFAGWIPAPQARSLQFMRVASDILEGLKQPDLALLLNKSASSHMRIDFDVDDDTPVTILFHLWCTTDPDTPRTRLTLQLDHLGARLDILAFEARRKQVEARIKALSDLDQL